VADPTAIVVPSRCRALADTLAGLCATPAPLLDANLFPPSSAGDAIIADYFFFLTAVDHGTHTARRRYQAVVGGRPYRGSDLLYALARRRQRTDPRFFTAPRLVACSAAEADYLWSPAGLGVKIKGARVRAALLRDAAARILQEYGGSSLGLIEASRGRLLAGDGTGLLERLAHFRAYADPLRKKSHLLAKLWERRGLLQVADPEHREVAADSVLMRIALRGGLVRVRDAALARRLAGGGRVSSGEEQAIRSATLRAFRRVARTAGLSPAVLDDLLWAVGREACPRLGPPPDPVGLEPRLARPFPSREAFRAFCLLVTGQDGAWRGRTAHLSEPRIETWYY
jgi:hypothetical protein